MRNIYEILIERERAVARVRQEVEALRLVALLLDDGQETMQMADSDPLHSVLPLLAGHEAEMTSVRTNMPERQSLNPVLPVATGPLTKTSQKLSRGLKEMAKRLIDEPKAVSQDLAG